MKTKSEFMQWVDGKSGYGSFQTYIFKAFNVADGTNMEKLKKAFPEWFNDSNRAVIQVKNKYGHWETFYIEKIDATHLYVSVTENGHVMATHIGEWYGEPHFKDLQAWLYGEIDINGRKYDVADPYKLRSQEIK